MAAQSQGAQTHRPLPALAHSPEGEEQGRGYESTKYNLSALQKRVLQAALCMISTHEFKHKGHHTTPGNFQAIHCLQWL